MSIDRDVAAGLFFIAIGALGLYIGADYAFGTPAKMGAGFVPKLLAWGLIGIGVIVALAGFAQRGENGMEAWAFGPLLVILASVVAFGAGLESLGFEGAAIGSILVASSGRARQSSLQIALLLIAIFGLTASLWPGMTRTIGHGATFGLLVASGAALLVHWILYAVTETPRALIEQFVLGGALAIAGVIVFADFLGLPFKSLFVLSVWLPFKAAVILPTMNAVRGIFRFGA